MQEIRVSTKNAVRGNKWIQQSQQIPSQHTKISCIHIHNEQFEKEITKTIPFITSSKRVKYLGSNQEGKRPVNENYKTLLKKIKDNINKCKHIPHSWIGRLYIVKMLMLFKMIQWNPYQNPNNFIKTEKPVLKFIWNLKWPEQSKQFWQRSTKQDSTFLDLKTYYKDMVTKTVQY